MTETIPKSLVHVAGEPFIHWQLHLLRDHGIRDIVICAGHLGDMIRDDVGDGAEFGLVVRYSFDSPVPLGTAGALRKALPLLDNEFFALYGDSYLTCDYAAVHAAFLASRQPALMTVYRNQGQFDASNTIFRDGTIQHYDKRNRTEEMEHIDYGLSVMSAAALNAVPPNQPFDLADVYGGLLAAGQLAGYEVSKRFYEIGSFEGIRELSILLNR